MDTSSSLTPTATASKGADRPPKPTALPVVADAIPSYLKTFDHWFCWRYTWLAPRGKRAGEWTKPPTNAATGRPGSSTNCATWSTFDQALDAYQTGCYDGIGFATHKHDEVTETGEIIPLLVKNKQTQQKGQCQCDGTDDLVLIDLDKCRNPQTGEVATWAQEIVEEVDSYWEISPSGTGCRGVAQGRKNAGRCKTDVLDKDGNKLGVFEIYETGRFVSLTGQHLPGTPAAVEERHEALIRLHARMFPPERQDDAGKRAGQKNKPDAPPVGTNGHAEPSRFTDDEIVAKLSRAKNSAKFNALMNGDTSLHGDDHSRADASLCSQIAFYTDDAEQIQRIFSRSQLATRDKYTERPDYGERTARKEAERERERYTPRGPIVKFSRNGAKTSANGDAHNGDGHDSEPEPPVEPALFTIGALTIRPGTARRTPAGVVKVPIGVIKAGALVADFVLSSTPSGWKGPAQLLSQLLEEESPGEVIDKAEITTLFRRVIADASRRADEPVVLDGPTVESIVKQQAPAAWLLTARTPKGGAWSEAKGGEVSRSEFTSYVPEELVEACGLAADAPKQANGTPARQDLVRQIQTELLVVWSSLLRTLPTQADANMGENTAAGRQFREQMVRLWTTPGTWEIPKTAAGEPSDRIGATKASLVSRIQSQKKEWDRLGGIIAPRESWRRIHPALSGWWRVAEVEGEVVVFLAMRWDLAGAVRQELTGVTDQKSLSHLGKQFGVLDPAPTVSASLSGGAERLAVLSQGITTELLAVPDDAADGPECPESDVQ